MSPHNQSWSVGEQQQSYLRDTDFPVHGSSGLWYRVLCTFLNIPLSFCELLRRRFVCGIMMNGADARIIQCLYRPPVIAILLYLGHTRPPKKPSNPLLVGFFTIQGVLSV